MAYDFFYDPDGVEYLICCLKQEFHSYQVGSEVPAPLLHLGKTSTPPSQVGVVLGNPGGALLISNLPTEGDPSPRWVIASFFSLVSGALLMNQGGCRAFLVQLHGGRLVDGWGNEAFLVDRWGNPFFGHPKSIGDPESYAKLPAEVRAEYQWYYPNQPVYEQLTLF